MKFRHGTAVTDENRECGQEMRREGLARNDRQQGGCAEAKGTLRLTSVAALASAAGAPGISRGPRSGMVASVEALRVLPLVVGAAGEQDVLLQLVEVDRLQLELGLLVGGAAKLLVAQRRARPLGLVPQGKRALLSRIDGRDRVVVRRVERVEIERARRRRRRRGCGVQPGAIGQPAGLELSSIGSRRTGMSEAAARAERTIASLGIGSARLT